MTLTLCLTIKIFSKRKILDKPLPNKRNKKKPKNWKNQITAKIEVEVVCLSAKLALPPIKLYKNGMAPAKRVLDFHRPLKDAILSLAEKENR